MAKSYYSMVVDRPAETVWQIIRPFDHYAWAGVSGEAIIEGGKQGDQVSAIRCVDTGGGRIIRQVLLAHSDVDHSYTYAFDGSAPFPVRDYVATIHVAPVGDGSAQAFVEWWRRSIARSSGATAGSSTSRRKASRSGWWHSNPSPRRRTADS
jgi:hypothetical protein